AGEPGCNRSQDETKCQVDQFDKAHAHLIRPGRALTPYATAARRPSKHVRLRPDRAATRILAQSVVTVSHDSLTRNDKRQPRFRKSQLRGMRSACENANALVARRVALSQTDHDPLQSMTCGDLRLTPLVDEAADSVL